MKRTSFTWTLAILLSSSCLPHDPTTDQPVVEHDVVVVDYDAPSTPSAPSTKEDAPSVNDTPPITEPDPEPEPEPPTAVELPGIPYALDPLPAGATAPWPGDASHGALVRVLEATDGDTVKIDTADGVVTVRLMGVNAPECDKHTSEYGKNCDPDDQDFAGEAEYFGVESWLGLRDLVEGQDVRLACKMVRGACETDLYDRTLAFLVVDGQDASEQMIADGLAWSYTQFPPDNIYTYCVAEESAMDGRIGIWSDGRDAAISRMNADTRRWYAYHDSTCDEHAP